MNLFLNLAHCISFFHIAKPLTGQPQTLSFSVCPQERVVKVSISILLIQSSCTYFEPSKKSLFEIILSKFFVFFSSYSSSLFFFISIISIIFFFSSSSSSFSSSFFSSSFSYFSFSYPYSVLIVIGIPRWTYRRWLVCIVLDRQNLSIFTD